MKFLKNIRSNSISAQIVFGFITLTALIVALEILGYVWIRQMITIDSMKESFARLKETQMQMKSASNEFILREKTNELFFATGKSFFLDRYAAQLHELQKNIEEIQARKEMFYSEDEAELMNLRNSLNAYDTVFMHMVNKLKIRGYGTYGLIGEFDKSVKTLLQYDFGTDKAAVINLQLFVKDYLLTGDEKIIDNISNEVFNFTMTLERHVRDEEVEKVSNILMSYETVFKELTEVDGELGIYTGGGLESDLFGAIDNLDKAIQLEKISTRINEARSANLFKLYFSFFLVVGAALIAAFIINRKLFRVLVVPIRVMKTIIAKMSLGEVPETSLQFKVAELNDMAKALNNLVSGTRNYQDFANNIGKGNLDNPFTPLSDQDILGSALLTMRDSLKSSAEADRKRTWATQGLAEMSMLLRNQVENNPEKLYNNILQFIVKYSGCNQGSLFLLTESGEDLELVACYAWEKRKYVEKRIKVSDGLIGQCIIEKDVVHVTDLPKNYISITSGLGYATPNTLLIVPLKVNDKVTGALEIAAFKKFEQYQIELLKKFAESVASAINIERINSRTKTMLLESRQQYEELRAKEQELKEHIRELELIQAAKKKVNGNKSHNGKIHELERDVVA
ncbi:hypothetical protein WSM22_26640 [Cytophagales bacterium WSM2-2]|nr:hypothetical protein WSM22_26640 [Cytophagales bacterium WSM2-2]